MACTITVSSSTELPNGQRQIVGICDLGDVYLTGGSTMDLSDYLSGSPRVTSFVDTTATYVAAHTHGTAAAGKMKVAVLANGTEVANAFNLATVVGTFVAVGTAV